jgi:hypothetical protein
MFSVFPVGLPEIDRELLKNLEGNSLINATQANFYLQEIADEQFWKEVILRDFGQEVLKLKPPHETYREQYAWLANAPLNVESPFDVTEDRLDYFQLYYYQGRPQMWGEIAREAAMEEDLNFLEWMISLPEERESIIGAADVALSMANLDLLKWFAKRGVYPHFEFIQDQLAEGEVSPEIQDWLRSEGLI